MKEEEKAEKIRLELEKQLEKPTIEAFELLKKQYVPVAEESEASEVLSMDEIERKFAKQDISVYGPTLGKLMEEAGYTRKIVVKKGTMGFCWLLKSI